MACGAGNSLEADMKRSPGRARTALSVLGALLIGASPALAQNSCSEPPPGRANLSGVVRAIPGDLPLPGATVIATWAGGNRQVETDADGRYSFCSLRAGLALTVRAGLAPYRGREESVDLGSGTDGLDLTVDLRASTEVEARGRLAGRVVDRETMEAVSGAQIALDDGDYVALTDAAGRFVLDDLHPGAGILRIRHLAYGENETALQIPSKGTLEVEIRLAPEALPVEPIAVTVLGMQSFKLDVSGFYERRELNERLGLGHYLTRREIEDRGAARVSHILSDVPRVGMLDGLCGSARCDVPVITSSGGDCRRLKDIGRELMVGASLYLDGVRMPVVSGWGDDILVSGIDEFLSPGDIAGIEVYTGAGDLPARFADANAQRCGAVVIWTGR